jgi:hypothetical protein
MLFEEGRATITRWGGLAVTYCRVVVGKTSYAVERERTC